MIGIYLTHTNAVAAVLQQLSPVTTTALVAECPGNNWASGPRLHLTLYTLVNFLYLLTGSTAMTIS